MKTKFSLLAIMAAITFAASTLTSSAQIAVTPAIPVNATGTNYQDSELLARAFLNYNIDHYQVYFSGQNLVSNQWQYTGIQLGLDPNQYVTNMTVNSVNIPLPHPLTGIPIPATGYQYVNVTVNALDKYGNVAATGNFNTNFLAQGGLIPVTMIPSFPPTAIQLPPGLNQSSINVAVTGSNGWGWSYDPVTGLLTISVFDNSTSVGYTITDNDGGLIARGTLPFFQAIPGAGTDTNSVLELDNAGGVLNLPLGSNGYNYANSLPFDGFAVRNGSYVPAKVVNVPDVGNTSKLYVYVGGPAVKIEVRQLTVSGPMTLIPCTTTTDGYGDTTAITTQYVGKCMVTILPTGTNAPGTFFLDLSRSY